MLDDDEVYTYLRADSQDRRKHHENIDLLPTFASDYWSKQFQVLRWTPTLVTLLEGTRQNDDESNHHCPLSLLRGHEGSLIRHIYSYYTPDYAKHLKLTIPATCVARLSNDDMVRFHDDTSEEINVPITSTSPSDYVAWTRCGLIDFPEPNNRNVNMMPFIYGDISSLPPDLQCYEDCIKACPISSSEKGKIYYLTVHESYVEPESSQRRGGLHIEAPGNIHDYMTNSFSPGREHHWGVGFFYSPDKYEGGIYMASSVSDTSRIYDALVDNSVQDIVDEHGGCEYLRPLMEHAGTNLRAGQLVWMTDRTPHEALPQDVAGHRTFFRVVTSEISHWFAMHSTPNPKVPLPENVVVVNTNKFVASPRQNEPEH